MQQLFCASEMFEIVSNGPKHNPVVNVLLDLELVSFNITSPAFPAELVCECRLNLVNCPSSVYQWPKVNALLTFEWPLTFGYEVRHISMPYYRRDVLYSLLVQTL